MLLNLRNQSHVSTTPPERVAAVVYLSKHCKYMNVRWGLTPNNSEYCVR